ncbi:MAG: FRG domain-containing protein [Bacteroidota bacterium]
MKYKDKEIKSVSDLIQKLKIDSKSHNGPIWFRGQTKKEHKLIPSLYRKSTSVSEMTLIKKFKQNASLLVATNCSEDFDWLFVMQHHGVPTRLLDWTESSLVALYFACEDNLDKEGALWVLLPTELNKHASIEPDETFDIPGINELENYSPKSYHADKTNVMGPAATISTRNTPRMQAQQGTFTIFHKKKSAIEEINDKKHVWRYLIPASSKKEILKELKLCGIDKFQLFPELSSIGETLKKEI